MATRSTGTTTVGVFNDRAAAERAVSELRAAGYRDDQIGLVARNAEGKTTRTDGAGDTYAEEGAVAGAAVGAGAMALGSLAVTFGVIPVIGPVLAVGPLAAALISGAAGAAAGGLTGALIGWGIPEEDAEYYQNEVQSGRYLVTVTGQKHADARAHMTRLGGYDRSTAATARTAGANETIQVKEEHLKAQKEQVKAGEVNVRKEVHTEHQQVNVPVEREEVVIERRPASGKAVAGDIKAEEIRIPVKEEHVRVSKEAVVKEEVNVGKRKVVENETVGGEVKKEEVVVETEGEAKVRATNKTDKR